MKSYKGFALIFLLVGAASILFKVSPPDTHYATFKKADACKLSLSADPEMQFPAGLRSAFEFSSVNRYEGTFNNKFSAQIIYFVHKVHSSFASGLFVLRKKNTQVFRAAVDLPTFLLKLLI